MKNNPNISRGSNTAPILICGALTHLRNQKPTKPKQYGNTRTSISTTWRVNSIRTSNHYMATTSSRRKDGLVPFRRCLNRLKATPPREAQEIKSKRRTDFTFIPLIFLSARRPIYSQQRNICIKRGVGTAHLTLEYMSPKRAVLDTRLNATRATRFTTLLAPRSPAVVSAAIATGRRRFQREVAMTTSANSGMRNNSYLTTTPIEMCDLRNRI